MFGHANDTGAIFGEQPVVGMDAEAESAALTLNWPPCSTAGSS
jgi:hypothetical protein